MSPQTQQAEPMEWEADALARGDDPADVSRRRSQMDELWERGESLIAAWDELRTALCIALEGERPEREPDPQRIRAAQARAKAETTRAVEGFGAIASDVETRG